MSTTEQKIDEMLTGFEQALAQGQDPRSAVGLLKHIQFHGTPLQNMRRERLIENAERQFPAKGNSEDKDKPADPLEEIIRRGMGIQ
ncbi:hypothetical protein [Paenarthrobacter ilicis]|uniref:hypothetical protein n=1 Tax=Paenarthrobacter ilicis TaxID=43665 RepID=UPI0028D281C0|nr:hypothetical protein [Paenarthrobacter ilicis]